jgi:hypothetical protein
MIRPSRAAFAFIFITVALDMLALGIMIPVLPKLPFAFTALVLCAALLLAARATRYPKLSTAS